jgi:hypothetical protein
MDQQRQTTTGGGTWEKSEHYDRSISSDNRLANNESSVGFEDSACHRRPSDVIVHRHPNMEFRQRLLHKDNRTLLEMIVTDVIMPKNTKYPIRKQVIFFSKYVFNVIFQEFSDGH